MATNGAAPTTDRGHRPPPAHRSLRRARPRPSGSWPPPAGHQRRWRRSRCAARADPSPTTGSPTAAPPAPIRPRVRRARSASAAMVAGHRAWLRPHLVRRSEPPGRRDVASSSRSATSATSGSQTRRLCIAAAARDPPQALDRLPAPIARPTARRHAPSSSARAGRRRPRSASGDELGPVALDEREGHRQRRGRRRLLHAVGPSGSRSAPRVDGTPAARPSPTVMAVAGPEAQRRARGGGDRRRRAPASFDRVDEDVRRSRGGG